MTQRHTVVPGTRSTWFYLDNETQVKGWRIYLAYDHKAGQEYWAADFKLLGRLLQDYKMRPIEGATLDMSRRAVSSKAQAMLEQIALPSPTKELHAL